MPVRLVPDEMLADYAVGAATPAVSFLVATQLAKAPEGRAIVNEFEHLGGVLLQEDSAAEMASDAFEAVLASLPERPDPIASGANEEVEGPLPAPVLDRVGVPFENIPWRFRLPGVSSYDFEGFGDEKVALMRVRPGRTIPQHTHEGIEMTLVLTGALEDQGTTYLPGDVAIADESDDHHPRVVGDEVCYCLIVQQGDLRFTGPFSRFFNIFGE